MLKPLLLFLLLWVVTVDWCSLEVFVSFNHLICNHIFNDNSDNSSVDDNRMCMHQMKTQTWPLSITKEPKNRTTNWDWVTWLLKNTWQQKGALMWRKDDLSSGSWFPIPSFGAKSLTALMVIQEMTLSNIAWTRKPKPVKVPLDNWHLW